MYAHRYFMREGLIYYGQDECDDRHIDIHKTRWRRKKDYTNDEITAEEYLQRAKAKLEEREEELKRKVIKEPGHLYTREYFNNLCELDHFMLFKSILEQGIKELEENNFELDRNPFEELDSGFHRRLH